MGILLSGEIEVYQNETLLKYLKIGETFSEEIAAKENSFLTCICSKPGKILNIKLDKFIRHIENDPDEIERLLNNMSSFFDYKFQKLPSGYIKFINKT